MNEYAPHKSSQMKLNKLQSLFFATMLIVSTENLCTKNSMLTAIKTISTNSLSWIFIKALRNVFQIKTENTICQEENDQTDWIHKGLN